MWKIKNFKSEIVKIKKLEKLKLPFLRVNNFPNRENSSKLVELWKIKKFMNKETKSSTCKDLNFWADFWVLTYVKIVKIKNFKI